MTGTDAQVIYGAYDQQDRLLYVGVTCNLEHRLAAHATTQWFWPQVSEVRILAEEPNEERGRTTEARLISTLNPRWNRVGRAPRGTWTADDYMDVLLDWMIAAPYSQRSARSLGRSQRALVAEANAQFGLNLSINEAELFSQLARGDEITAFGRRVQVTNAPERPSVAPIHTGLIFSGDATRAIREAFGMSLREVAGEIDMEVTALHQFETGKRIPSDAQAQAIADALGVPLAAISFATRVVVVSAIPEPNAA